jgi:hypothetical protein
MIEIEKYRLSKQVNRLPGGLGEVVPPVPIPNTAVKRFSADDTEGVTSCGKYATARKLVFLSSLLVIRVVIWWRQFQGGRNGESI